MCFLPSAIAAYWIGKKVASWMRLDVSWSPLRRMAALVFSGNPRPSLADWPMDGAGVSFHRCHGVNWRCVSIFFFRAPKFLRKFIIWLWLTVRHGKSPIYKWRFLAEKAIYFYGPSITLRVPKIWSNSGTSAPSPAAEKPAARATTFLKPPQSSTPKTSCHFWFKQLGPVGKCSIKLAGNFAESIFVHCPQNLLDICWLACVVRTEKFCEFNKFQSTRLCCSLEHPSVALVIFVHGFTISWWHVGDTLVTCAAGMVPFIHDLHWPIRIYPWTKTDMTYIDLWESMKKAHHFNQRIRIHCGQWPLQSARAPHRWPHWHLVGGWPTPLKSDGVRQLGWWHSQLNGKIKNVVGIIIPNMAVGQNLVPL